MSPTEQELVIRMNAAEYMLSLVFCELFRNHSDPLARAERIRNVIDAEIASAQFPGTSTDKEDHFAIEMAARVQRTLQVAVDRLSATE